MEELFVSAKSLADKEKMAYRNLDRIRSNMDSQVLFGTGYEGEVIGEFIQKLKTNCIEQLADIREIPNSRKQGFSKSKLTLALAEQSIKYQHFKSLGSPRPIRQKLRSDKNYNIFFEEYEDYLSNQGDALIELENFIIQGKTVLLCFEEDSAKCHRKSVLFRLEKRGFEIIHI